MHDIPMLWYHQPLGLVILDLIEISPKKASKEQQKSKPLEFPVENMRKEKSITS